MTLSPDPRWLNEWVLHRSLQDTRPEEPKPAWRPDPSFGIVAPRKDDEVLARLWRSIDQPWFGAQAHGLLSHQIAAASTTYPESAAIPSGSILQLSPALLGPIERPVHVLVAKVGSERAEIMVFSPFAWPASPDEIATGLEEEGLRVLQIWNRSQVRLGSLLQAWKLDIDGGKIADAAGEIRAAAMAARPLAPDLAKRVGPSVDAPDDPRWDYFEEEGQILHHLQCLDASMP